MLKESKFESNRLSLDPQLDQLYDVHMQFAILGSQPNLSLAEIEAVTKQSPLRHSDKVALFDNLETELSHLQNRLGGVQKLGYIIGSLKSTNLSDLADLAVANLLEKTGEKKIKFGFSVYEIRNEKTAAILRGKLERTGLEIKRLLKEAGRNARLVTSKEATLSSVVIAKNKLLQQGAEFVLIAEKDEILIGLTETIQDFESWSFRDFERPARDARRGMLPPKLARIMINLAGVDPGNKTLLDPFCGSGTVLMEASLLGFEKLIGSDIQKQAIADTEKNLLWQEHQELPVSQFELFEASADKLIEFVPAETVDLIVTEPFLGTPRQGRESKEDIEKTIAELDNLYQKSFSTLFKLLKPGGVIVVASPVHLLADKEFGVNTGEILKKIGFKPDPITKQHLLYRQKDQFVARDILRFKKLSCPDFDAAVP